MAHKRRVTGPADVRGILESSTGHCAPTPTAFFILFIPNSKIYEGQARFFSVMVPLPARRTLRQFVESLAGQQDQRAVKAALDAGFHDVSKAAWTHSGDVKDHYATPALSMPRVLS